MLLLAFVFFYFQLSMIMAFGNFAHYATFMSARALLSASEDQGDQKQRARSVIVAMLKKSAGQAGVDRFPPIARGTGGSGDIGGFNPDPPGEYQPAVRAFSWMQGVRYTFKSKLFMLPLAGSKGKGDLSPSVNSLTLTSESWLGRDPSYFECQLEMKNYNGIFDNGC